MSATDVSRRDPDDRRGSSGAARVTPAGPVPAPRPEPEPTWSLAVDHFREGLVICDGGGLVRQVSAAAARLLPEVVVGEPLTATPPGRLLAAVDGGPPQVLTDRGRRLLARSVRLSVDRRAWYVEDVTTAPTAPARRAPEAFLTRVDRELAHLVDPEPAARAVLTLAVPALAGLAVLVLAPAGGRARWWRAVDRPGGAEFDEGSTGTQALPAVVQEALAGVPPASVTWLADQFADLGWLSRTGDCPARVRVLPVPGGLAPVGALVLADRTGRRSDRPGDGDLPAFAARAGAAVETALLHREQAEVTETLRVSLAPVPPPPVPGVEWGAAYRPEPTRLRVGGDFYGAHPLPDGQALFFLGDVSGKGVAAAMFTGQLRQALVDLRHRGADPVELLRLLNDAVLGTAATRGRGGFATLVLGLARSRPGGGLRLSLSSGGHLPPLVLRADGRVERVPLRGTLVGVVPDPCLGRATVHLGPGESCLLYSDGVTQARNPRRGGLRFGTERLIAALAGCQPMPAPALAQRVEQVTGDWLAGGGHDDLAALVVRARPARHLRVVPGKV